MNLIINGQSDALDKDSLSISDLITIKGVKMPDMVSVQLNGEFVKKENFHATMVKENDEIEFLYFMGGGG